MNENVQQNGLEKHANALDGNGFETLSDLKVATHNDLVLSGLTIGHIRRHVAFFANSEDSDGHLQSW